MKLLRWSIFFCSAIVLVFAIGMAVLPRILNNESIRERIRAEFAGRVGSDLAIGKIALSWLPRPRIAIEHAELSLHENQHISIRSVEIYPRLRDLLIGRFSLGQLGLLGPQLKIRLKHEPEKTFDAGEIEQWVTAALNRLIGDLRASHITVADGSAEIIIDGSSRLILDHVAGRAGPGRGKFELELSAHSNLWENLGIQGNVSPENLAFQFGIAVERLKLNDALVLARFREFESTPEGKASFRLQISGTGLRRLEAAITGFPEPLPVVRRGGRALFDVKQFKGRLSYEQGAYEVAVEQLALVSPRIEASGQIQFQPDRVSATVNARNVDVAEFGGLVRRAADRPEQSERILRSLGRGTISELSIKSEARSFAGLISAENVAGQGTLRNCTIFIPVYELELKNVDAAVHVEKGQLKADEVRLRLGGMQGRSGRFRLDLRSKHAPFHLDVAFAGRAAELLDALRKVARDEAARAELAQVRNVEGELSGTLSIGKNADALTADLSLSKANARAEYALVPFPIVMRGGRLKYENELLRIENVRGAVGDSQFDALDVLTHRDGSRRLKIGLKSASLDLQQTETLLRRFASLRPQLQKLTAARGRADLAAVSLAGQYDDPTGWTFAGTGKLDRVEIQHVDLPEALSVTRANFDASQERVLFSGAEATLGDAALSAGGKIEYHAQRPLHIEAGGRATLGERMTRQLARSLDLPDEMRLRSPLSLVAERLTWSPDGDRSFRGHLGVDGRAVLKIDALKRAREIVVDGFTFEDLGKGAHITLRRADDSLAFSFDGELTQETINRVFVSFPFDGATLRGDFQVNAPQRLDPMTMSAWGRLTGTRVFFPLGNEKARAEEFSVEADGSTLLVRSADLRWRDSRLAISGKLDAGKKVLRVDLDATGDRLTLAELNRLFGEEKQDEGTRSRGSALPPIEGRIGLQFDNFLTEHFTINALQVETTIAPSSVRADIKHGLMCGIQAIGYVNGSTRDIDLDVRFSAKDADLEPTTVCLTNQQSNVKGTYSLSARLAGRGSPENLRAALKGNFQMDARDGAFVRSSGLDAAFDYLNDSGDFAVEFPDLNKQAFAYRILTAKGNVDGQRIQSDEIFIQAAPYTIAGQGSFDLHDRMVDLKGLVSVALPAHQVIKRIPLLGAVMGGSLVGIPVRIKGPVDRPEISYLSPGDVGAELVNIPLRVLGMPLDAIKLFIPSATAVNR